MLGRLNHVAIAVPDLAKGTQVYRAMLGAKVSAPQAEPAHGVLDIATDQHPARQTEQQDDHGEHPDIA